MKSYDQVMVNPTPIIGPWKSIWMSKAPPRVAFFVWTAVLGKILTLDNLRKKNIIVMEWCCMCKYIGESIDQLLLHCEVAMEVWSMVFQLFGVMLVMPGRMKVFWEVFFVFLISRCIIYQKKVQSASKDTRKMQSTSSIQRKPKNTRNNPKTKPNTKSIQRNPKQPKTSKVPKQHPTETALVLLLGSPSATPEGTKTHFSIPTSLATACLSLDRWRSLDF